MRRLILLCVALAANARLAPRNLLRGRAQEDELKVGAATAAPFNYKKKGRGAPSAASQKLDARVGDSARRPSVLPRGQDGRQLALGSSLSEVSPATTLPSRCLANARVQPSELPRPWKP